MKINSRMLTAGVECCLLMAVLSGESFSATPITYSWTGFVAPVGARDPLALGPTLTPYTLEATIPDISAPIMTRQPGFASFDLSDFRLVVDGREFSTAGTGRIHFTDRESTFGGIEAGLGLADSIDVVAKVSYAGADWLFLSVVPLSSDTLFFPTETSLPPLFPPLEAIEEGSSSLSLPNSLGGFDLIYWNMERAPRVTATVVPEPQTLLLALTCFLACFAIRFGRRNGEKPFQNRRRAPRG
jgi:hypothetical protein